MRHLAPISDRNRSVPYHSATVPCIFFSAQVVAQIEEGALLPPLIVVQIVSQHPLATIDLVRGYMQRSLVSCARTG